MKKIYIVGATGYIGHNLLKALGDKGEQNVSLVSRDLVDLSNTGFDTFIDTLNPNDFCIILAALSSPDVCEKEFDRAYEVNVTNTSYFIDKLICKKVRVLFASSDTVFGLLEGVATDDSPLAPIGAYGEMKAQVEQKFKNEKYFKAFRLSYVLGPDDKFSQMIKECNQSDKELSVFEGFERNVVTLNDVIEGINNLVLKWDQIEVQYINFAGPELLSRYEIVKTQAFYLYPNLKFKETQAPDGFWKGRAKVIKMNSDHFPLLLNRPASYVKDILKDWS